MIGKAAYCIAEFLTVWSVTQGNVPVKHAFFFHFCVRIWFDIKVMFGSSIAEMVESNEYTVDSVFFH